MNLGGGFVVCGFQDFWWLLGFLECIGCRVFSVFVCIEFGAFRAF